MKENVLEVLMYLFENHMEENCDILFMENSLRVELESVGFEENSIDQAFNWLDGLIQLQRTVRVLKEKRSNRSNRVFSPYEMMRLDANCRGFLLYLSQVGILNSETFELAVDRALGLHSSTIDLNQIKWVTLMVLFNQPDEQAALACMEQLVLEENSATVH